MQTPVDRPLRRQRASDPESQALIPDQSAARPRLAARRWLAGGYLPDAVLLIALNLLFFWRDLTSNTADHRGFAAGDFADQFYAFARYAAARLHAGRLPLWNPYTFSGHPFLADIQSGVFYPFNLLTMLVTAGTGFGYTALQLEAVLHFPLVAIFTYLLARRLTASRWGGLVAAVTFTFSGYLTSYPPLQLAILQVQTWLPLILLLLDIAASRARRGLWRAATRWALAAGLVFGVSLLAGHPQASLLVAYASLAFGSFRLWSPANLDGPKHWLRPLGLLALFGAAGCGLAAVQLLPSLQFMTLSTRAGISFEEAGGGFNPYDLIQAFLPAVGVPFPALYVGVLPLGLAALALVKAAQGRLNPYGRNPSTLRRASRPPDAAAGPANADRPGGVILAVDSGTGAGRDQPDDCGDLRQDIELNAGVGTDADTHVPLIPPDGALADGTAHSVALFLGWGALLGLLLSFGKITPVYTLFYLLAPGWRLFRGQERTVVWVVLAVALLAGYGAAWLVAQWEERRTTLPHADDARPPIVSPAAPPDAGRGLARCFGFAALAAAGLALACFVGYQAGSKPLWGFTAATAFLTLLLALAALIIHTHRPILMIALLVLDLFTLVGGSHAGTAETAVPFPDRPILAGALADTGTFRVANEDVLPLNYGMVYGLEDIYGASPLRTQRYQEFLDRVPVGRVWQLLNVKYVLTARENLDVPAQRVGQGSGPNDKPQFLFRLAQTNPRAWLAGSVAVEPDAEKLWARLGDPAFDPLHQVVLPAGPSGFVDNAGCAGEPGWIAREPEHLALVVTSGQSCVLVLSEVDYPGWQATMDGKPAAILQADGLLRAVIVPAGEHSISFDFRPPVVFWGAGLSAVTLLLAAAWLAWPHRARVA